MKQTVQTSKVSITKKFRSKSLFNFQGPERKAEARSHKIMTDRVQRGKTLHRDIRGYSSAGRAPALQAGGQRFDPAYLHHREGNFSKIG